MALAKRIIPCLDVQDGRTVKGINFVNIRDAGDAVELGELYAREGADELVFLDITATIEERKTFAELVTRIARHINIPFTVGGGISSVEDVSILLNAGADKISINTAAVKKPQLIDELAKQFGSQCIVVAIDAKAPLPPEGGISPEFTDALKSMIIPPSGGRGAWFVHLHGGRTPTTINAIEWAKEAAGRGAGEILLTSMNNDGTKKGFALDITRTISEAVNIPVIASGGAGTMDHFCHVFNEGKADAALAASIFHYKEIGIPDLKRYLKKNGIEVRV